MNKRRGRPPRMAQVSVAVDETPEPRRQFRTVSEIVGLMIDYRDNPNARFRGLVEDCKSDIYRLFGVDYNDTKAVDDIRPTGCSDRIYREWEMRFSRAIGKSMA